ncbi:hypothetical protein EDC04DRAFT_2946677 [Pisolithus marmoratus]|nr:hypothetical protein EDC04DRAFT_2946677 [Pisolithus marmoratus]
MHHPAHPGLAQEEEDFTGAIDDAGRLSDEDSEFSTLEDEEPEPSGSDADELRQMCVMVAPHAANATPEETCQVLEEMQNALLELSECWVSPLMIKDRVKSELFQFIPKEDHPLMAHCIFGDNSTGSAIFGLLAEFFLHSFDCFKEPRCQKLLLSPNQKYTKFAPCLFPNFLKNVPSCLAFFGKSSLAGCNAPGPKPKQNCGVYGLLQPEWWQVIFVLSGDTALNTKGDKTQIPYLEWHNYFCSCLLNCDAWA